MDSELLPPEIANDAALSHAVGVLNHAGLSEDERLVYEGEERKRMVDAVQIRDAVQRGRQEGREEGVQLGREEGVVLGLQRSLLRQLSRRLGAVPADVSAALQRLSVDGLDALDMALPDLHTYADVEQWMAHQE